MGDSLLKLPKFSNSKYVIIAILIIVTLFYIDTTEIKHSNGAVSITNLSNTYVDGLSKNILRFHVIANSDSADDQRVKLKVRDAILASYKNTMTKCKNKNEAIKFLNEKKLSIEKTADQILAQNNKNYKAISMIGDFPFPSKAYGDIVLPPGKYSALRVVLGEGKGRNWWCVMFPPLCFIDITMSNATEQSDKTLLKAIDKKTLNKIKLKNNTSSSYQYVPAEKGKYIFKFKVVELIKNMLKK